MLEESSAVTRVGRSWTDHPEAVGSEQVLVQVIRDAAVPDSGTDGSPPLFRLRGGPERSSDLCETRVRSGQVRIGL